MLPGGRGCMGKRSVHTFAIVTALVVAACQAANPIPSAPSSPSAPASGVSSDQPSGPPASGSPVASLPPAPPTSQQLIRADLDAGAIDLATSLELRAWALFGDARLPERYDGSGSTGEDGSLFEEIAANLDSLPADKHDELARYLLRPTDSQSPFSAAAPVGAAGGGGLLALAGVMIAQTTQQNGPCPND